MKCHVCRQGVLIRQHIGWSCDKCRVAVLSAVPRYRIYPMPFAPTSVVETPDGEWVRWQDIQEEITALRATAEKIQALVSSADKMKARVDWLEANIAQAVRLIRPACQFDDEPWLTASELIAVARTIRATLATDAIAERKEPT